MEKRTAGNTSFSLNLCVSYGGRGDVARAARRCCEEVAAGTLLPAQVDESAVAQVRLTGGIGSIRIRDRAPFPFGDLWSHPRGLCTA